MPEQEVESQEYPALTAADQMVRYLDRVIEEVARRHEFTWRCSDRCALYWATFDNREPTADEQARWQRWQTQGRKVCEWYRINLRWLAWLRTEALDGRIDPHVVGWMQGERDGRAAPLPQKYWPPLTD